MKDSKRFDTFLLYALYVTGALLMRKINTKEEFENEESNSN